MEVKDAKIGKLVTNGVVLEPHEYETVVYFLKLGNDVELIPASHTPKMKRADFWMDGLEWEPKVPFINTKRAVERMFFRALEQSKNVVFDLRKLKGEDQIAIETLEFCFKTTRSMRSLLIVAKDGTFKKCKKK